MSRYTCGWFGAHILSEDDGKHESMEGWHCIIVFGVLAHAS